MSIKAFTKITLGDIYFGRFVNLITVNKEITVNRISDEESFGKRHFKLCVKKELKFFILFPHKASVQMNMHRKNDS
jgi:hypothetical protein